MPAPASGMTPVLVDRDVLRPRDHRARSRARCALLGIERHERRVGPTSLRSCAAAPFLHNSPAVPRPTASKVRSVALLVSAVVVASCKTSSDGVRSGSSIAARRLQRTAEAPIVEAAATSPAPGPRRHALQRQLHCPDRRHGRACRILREFEQASHGMAQAPSGQGRFMGTAYRVEKGVEKSELVVLVAFERSGEQRGPNGHPAAHRDGFFAEGQGSGRRQASPIASHGAMPAQSNKRSPSRRRGPRRMAASPIERVVHT